MSDQTRPSPSFSPSELNCLVDVELANSLLPLFRARPGAFALIASELLMQDQQKPTTMTDETDELLLPENPPSAPFSFESIVTELTESSSEPPKTPEMMNASLLEPGQLRFRTVDSSPIAPTESQNSRVTPSPTPPQDKSTTPEMHESPSIALSYDWTRGELGLLPGTTATASSSPVAISKTPPTLSPQDEFPWWEEQRKRQEEEDEKLARKLQESLMPGEPLGDLQMWLDRSEKASEERKRQEEEDERMAREMQERMMREERPQGRQRIAEFSQSSSSQPSAADQEAGWSTVGPKLAQAFASAVQSMDWACGKMIAACSDYRNAAVCASSSGKQRASNAFEEAWGLLRALISNPAPASGAPLPFLAGSADKFGLFGYLASTVFDLDLPLTSPDQITPEQATLFASLFRETYPALRRIMLAPLNPDLHALLGLRTVRGLPSKRAFESVFRPNDGSSASTAFSLGLKSYLVPLSQAVQGLAIAPLLLFSGSQAVLRRIAADPLLADLLACTATDTVKMTNFLHRQLVPETDVPVLKPQLELLSRIAFADPTSFRSRIMESQDRQQRAFHSGPHSLQSTLKEIMEMEIKGRDDLKPLVEQSAWFLEAMGQLVKGNAERIERVAAKDGCDRCGKELDSGDEVRCSCGWAWFCSVECKEEAKRGQHAKDCSNGGGVGMK